MKSPTFKIQSPAEGLIKIEPLYPPEPPSVPPLGSGGVAAGCLAVPTSVRPLAPEVRDATSVAASQVAWTGDPQAPPHQMCVEPSRGTAYTFQTVLRLLDCEPPEPPDLDQPLDLEDPFGPVSVFTIERDYLPCFRDERYAELPVKGPLYSFFYTTLVFQTAHPFRPSVPRRPDWRVAPAPPVLPH